MSQTQAKKEGRFIDDPEIMNTICEHSIAHSFLYSIKAGTEIAAPDTRTPLILAFQETGVRILPQTKLQVPYLAKLQCVLVAVGAVLVPYSTAPVRYGGRMRTIIVLKSTHDRGVHHPGNHEKLRKKTLHAALLSPTSYHS